MLFAETFIPESLCNVCEKLKLVKNSLYMNKTSLFHYF